MPIAADVPIACHMGALNKEERTHYDELRRILQPSAQFHELDDGYSLTVPDAMLTALLQWIDMERRCCPFLRFTLTIPGNGEAPSLALQGTEGTKEFLQAELGL
jgi:hypothetical protein